MSCHIILGPVVIYDRRLRLVLLFRVLDLIVQNIGFVGQFLYAVMDRCFHLGVFAQCPIVLIPNICPANFLIKVKLLLLVIHSLTFGRYLFLFLAQFF